jgi:hypothetical protein
MPSALSNLIFPELRPLDPHARAEALRAARRTPFEVAELLALAAALVGAAAMRRADLGVAIAIVVILAVLVRRLRRGLRQGPGEGSR